MPDDNFSVRDFGSSFKQFIDHVTAAAPAARSAFETTLRNHFGAEPQQLPVVGEQLEVAEHVNLQLAIDAYIGEEGRTSSLLGVNDSHTYRGVKFADLLEPGQIFEAPVEYLNLPAAEDRVIPCVQRGLYLVSDGEHRLAVLVRGASDYSYHRRLTLDVMASTKAEAEEFLRTIRRSMRARNVYRGKIVSLSLDEMQSLQVHFHHLPQITREQIVLPDGLLDRIERQTIGFAKAAGRLRDAGRHLKRGLLLHGSPGTGKTLTAMYLAAQMRDRTILLLTGRALGLIETSCWMARALQPSTVILEDVDLVAEERTRPGQACSVILFELLNQMDGLADDADILFILTTNRPDILEPALAARPGRVDQAIEIPMPDAVSRRRLFDLYGRGLRLDVEDIDQFVRRTEGVSAAFIRELLRRAALIATEDDGPELVVTDRHVDEALHELIVTGGALTRALLGANAHVAE